MANPAAKKTQPKTTPKSGTLCDKLAKKKAATAPESGDLLSDLFNPEHFSSVQLTVALTNTTTQTEIRDGKRFFNGVQSLPTMRDGNRENFEVFVAEFTEEGFVFETPRNTCAKGHNVLCVITATVPSGESCGFEFSGKVKDVVPLDGESDSVDVKMVQYEEKQWLALQELYSQRQNEIEDFFKAVKG